MTTQQVRIFRAPWGRAPRVVLQEENPVQNVVSILEIEQAQKPASILDLFSPETQRHLQVSMALLALPSETCGVQDVFSFLYARGFRLLNNIMEVQQTLSHLKAEGVFIHSQLEGYNLTPKGRAYAWQFHLLMKAVNGCATGS